MEDHPAFPRGDWTNIQQAALSEVDGYGVLFRRVRLPPGSIDQTLGVKGFHG